jgi:MFS family permease
LTASSFPALRDRRYAWFLVAMVASNVGSWMERLALSTLVYEMTGHDEGWLAAVLFAPALPVLLLSMPAGALVDRVGVRKLVLWMQVAMAVTAGGMALWLNYGDVEPWHVTAYALLASALFAFDAPGRQALVPRIVDRPHLTNAVALNAFAFNSARLLGGAAYWAVLHFTHWGEVGCVALNALTYLLPIAVLIRIREAPPVPHDHPEPAGHAFLAGMRYAWRSRVVRASLLVLAVSGFFGFQVSQLLPVFAEKVYGTGKASVGTMQAWFGVGAVAGALFLASRSGTAHRGKVVMRCTLGAGLLLAVMAFVEDLTLACVVLPLCGFLLIQIHSGCTALIQGHVPDSLRGRVSALFTLTVLFFFPLGGLFAGFVAKAWGAQGTVLLCAEMLVACVLAVAWTHKEFRETA